MLQKSDRIYVAGHRGLVGSALVRALQRKGYDHLLLKSHAELDLLNQDQVSSFLQMEKPDVVLLAAAKVGGIGANMRFPAEFIAQNLMIETNVIHGSYAAGVKRLLFLGSSCIYPKLTPQPIPEEALLTGPLEPSNAPYALAKIAGIALCDSYNREYGTHYRAVMPTNLYGPGDSFDLQNSHVLPALIRRFHEAKEANTPSVTLWGTGKAMREFLFVDDLADACIYLLEKQDSTELINIGTGTDLSIADLAALVAKVIGYPGKILFDAGKPDGTPRKLLNIGKLLQSGWIPHVTLEEGIRMTYQWYCSHARQGTH